MKHYSGNLIYVVIIYLFIIGGCDKESSPIHNLPAEQFQEILNLAVEDAAIPGAIMGIHVSGATWYGAAGKADTLFCDPMTSDMQVRLASITKPFTAVLTMKLVEEGVLSLEDTVEELLPEHVPQGEKMTLKMLLNHSKKYLFINNDNSHDPIEEEANRFAADFLIPERYNDMIINATSDDDMKKNSDDLGLSTDIVAGRYQYLTDNWSKFNKLKRKITW